MLQSLIIFALLFQLFFIISIVKDDKLNNIFKLSLICYVIFWIFAPGITALILDVLNQDSVKLLHKDFCIYYISEFLILYFSVQIIKLLSKKSDKINEYKFSDSLIYKVIFSLLIILIFNYYTTPKLSYIENNTIDGASNNLLTPITSIFKTFFFSFLIFVSCITTKKKIFWLSLFAVLITVSFMMISGARISISAIFFIILYRIIFISSSKVKLLFNLFLTAVFISILVMPILIGIEKARSDDLNISEISNNLDTKSVISVFTSVFQKFNSIDAGIKLVNGYGSGVAGLKPYIGSVFIFVPQYFYPKKPISGSIDNTYFGTPARLVVQYDNPDDLAGNVGVAPLAVTIWQFGWIIGPLSLFIFTTFNLFFLNFLMNSNRPIINAIGTYFLPLPGFIGIFSSPDVYLKNTVYLIFFIIIVFFFNIIYKQVILEVKKIKS
jgi:hypothetical protein